MAKPRKPHERRPSPRMVMIKQNAEFTNPNAGAIYKESGSLIKQPEKSAAYWASKFRRSEGQKRRAKVTGKPINWSGQGLGRRKK